MRRMRISLKGRKQQKKEKWMTNSSINHNNIAWYEYLPLDWGNIIYPIHKCEAVIAESKGAVGREGEKDKIGIIGKKATR